MSDSEGSGVAETLRDAIENAITEWDDVLIADEQDETLVDVMHRYVGAFLAKSSAGVAGNPTRTLRATNRGAGSGHSPQPTETEIEAGARALYEVRKQPGQVKWEHLMQGSSRANYRHQARSVLIAALAVSGEMPRQARAPQHP